MKHRISIRFRLAIPNNPALTGAKFYLQGAAHDPAANPMRMTTTYALALQIGL